MSDAVTPRPFLHLEVVENEYIESKQYYVTWRWTTYHVLNCVFSCAWQCIVYKSVAMNTNALWLGVRLFYNNLQIDGY